MMGTAGLQLPALPAPASMEPTEGVGSTSPLPVTGGEPPSCVHSDRHLESLS